MHLLIYLQTLDAEIEQVKSEVQQTRDQVRELQQRYQMLTSALTNEQIVERLAELKEKVLDRCSCASCHHTKYF